MPDDLRRPAFVLTGFLGSGKTTILKHLVSLEEMRDTALVINEFGEIALDHHLVSDVREDMIVLGSGCVCCSVRNDLVRAMCDLWVKAARREIPRFRRVIIETTGLADPTPVLTTLAKNGLVTHAYRLGAIVATVDGQNGDRSFERHPESIKQAAMADRIVLTKADLISASERARLEARIREIQHLAPIVESTNGRIGPHDLFGDGTSDHLRFSRLPLDDDDRRLAREHPDHAHGDSVRTFSVVLDDAVSFKRFALWLSMMTQFHGDHLLRVKGLLRVDDDDKPVVVQSVQHVVYRTESLPRWPDEDRRSRLVFIARGLEGTMVEQIQSSLRELVEPAAPSARSETVPTW
jgi:G3E family GTPase